MQFLNLAADQIANHVIECGVEKQKQMHPEVMELEPIVDNDPGDEDDPEANDDHTSHK